MAIVLLPKSSVTLVHEVVGVCDIRAEGHGCADLGAGSGHIYGDIMLEAGRRGRWGGGELDDFRLGAGLWH